MEDIAPALLAKIQEVFRAGVAESPQAQRIQNRIRDGTGTQRDAHRYATLLGEILSKALTSILTADALPDGRLYWNIAQRTIKPMLKQNHALVNEASVRIQSAIDAAQGIGLQAIGGELPESRIDGLVKKAADAQTEYLKWLREPIVNCSASFYTDFVKTNAAARYRAGMGVKIIRTGRADCCPWCAAMLGEYDYKKAPADIYKRHEFCHCETAFVDGPVRQNVWSKEVWEDDPAVLEMRKSMNIEIDRR